MRQLPDLARHLKPDVLPADLARLAVAESDTAAARKMQAAKSKLFAGLRQKRSAS